MNLGTIGVIFTGGGFTGAISVGFAKAIWKSGLRPAHFQGTSVGALNVTEMIGGGIDALEQTWLNIEKQGAKEIFNWWDAPYNIRSNALFYNKKIRQLVDSADIKKVVADPRTLQIITRNETRDWGMSVHSNRDSRFQANPESFRLPILASTAIPGCLPPIPIDGEIHSDGTYFSLKSMIELGCDTIFLLLNDQAANPQRWDQRFFFARHLLYEEAVMARLKQDLEDHKDFLLIDDNNTIDNEKERIPSLVVKIRAQFQGIARDIAQGEEINLIPHRIIIFNSRTPISTLHTLGFERGDIRAAIAIGEQQATQLLEKLLK